MSPGLSSMRVSTMRHRALTCTRTLCRLYACEKPYAIFWDRRLCYGCIRHCSSTGASLQYDVGRPRGWYSGKPPQSARQGHRNRRNLTTVSNGVMTSRCIGVEKHLLTTNTANPDAWGPLNEYDERIHSRQLKDDEHQRGILFLP